MRRWFTGFLLGLGKICNCSKKKLSHFFFFRNGFLPFPGATPKVFFFFLCVRVVFTVVWKLGTPRYISRHYFQ